MHYSGSKVIRHPHTLLVALTLALTLTALQAMATDAKQACTTDAKETPLRSEQASAGIMVNLAESPDSIRATVKQLLGEAVNAAKVAQAPTIVFRVAPTSYLPLPEQQALCTQLAMQTSAQPLRYPDHVFANVEDFDSWLTAFSQGQDTDGKLLYQQCGGNCDPSFTFVVSRGDTNLAVATEVYCGYARDRKVNLYTLSTTMRGACSAAP